ncbi:MAG: hypothetical protein NTU44_13170, partial [Bacteroidetes bacterium]|nr:hypothetical protein [Bacteroidota bacterium]
LDGDPKMEKIENSKLEEVVNTSDIILHDPNTGKFYLNAADSWFASGNISGPWTKPATLPEEVTAFAATLKKTANNDNSLNNQVTNRNAVPIVYLSTIPAELIQSDGPATFSPVEGTTLSYVSNSPDNIFLDNSSGKYYVLIGGRWYTADRLEGSWQSLPADQLPSEFSRIPEGWEKDNVLASIPNTKASRTAIHQAQVAQVAKVNRQTATTQVEYDGDPNFEQVENTPNTYYASNTSSSVLRIGNSYYCVDNGIWYVANGPNGPWSVATERPQEVEEIPSSSPVYYVRYVYIYDVTPDYVITGYTPCYTGSYIYGHTVVYGTGYHYKPWHQHHYYPRPYTWGYGMMYDPYVGWCFGPTYYSYHPDYYYGENNHHWHHHNGWWGPEGYYPPDYYYPYYYSNNPEYQHYWNNYYSHPDHPDFYHNQPEVHPITPPQPYIRPTRTSTSGPGTGTGQGNGPGSVHQGSTVPTRTPRSGSGIQKTTGQPHLPQAPVTPQSTRHTVTQQPAVNPQTPRSVNDRQVPKQPTSTPRTNNKTTTSPIPALHQQPKQQNPVRQETSQPAAIHPQTIQQAPVNQESIQTPSIRQQTKLQVPEKQEMSQPPAVRQQPKLQTPAEPVTPQPPAIRQKTQLQTPEKKETFQPPAIQQPSNQQPADKQQTTKPPAIQKQSNQQPADIKPPIKDKEKKQARTNQKAEPVTKKAVDKPDSKDQPTTPTGK